MPDAILPPPSPPRRFRARAVGAVIMLSPVQRLALDATRAVALYDAEGDPTLVALRQESGSTQAYRTGPGWSTRDAASITWCVYSLENVRAAVEELSGTAAAETLAEALLA